MYSLLPMEALLFPDFKNVEKEVHPLEDLNRNVDLDKPKAFCQWKHFFFQASDDLEKEVHPLEEYGADKNI